MCSNIDGCNGASLCNFNFVYFRVAVMVFCFVVASDERHDAEIPCSFTQDQKFVCGQTSRANQNSQDNVLPEKSISQNNKQEDSFQNGVIGSYNWKEKLELETLGKTLEAFLGLKDRNNNVDVSEWETVANVMLCELLSSLFHGDINEMLNYIQSADGDICWTSIIYQLVSLLFQRTSGYSEYIMKGVSLSPTSEHKIVDSERLEGHAVVSYRLSTPNRDFNNGHTVEANNMFSSYQSFDSDVGEGGGSEALDSQDDEEKAVSPAVSELTALPGDSQEKFIGPVATNSESLQHSDSGNLRWSRKDFEGNVDSSNELGMLSAQREVIHRLLLEKFLLRFDSKGGHRIGAGSFGEVFFACSRAADEVSKQVINQFSFVMFGCRVNPA